MLDILFVWETIYKLAYLEQADNLYGIVTHEKH